MPQSNGRLQVQEQRRSRGSKKMATAERLKDHEECDAGGMTPLFNASSLRVLKKLREHPDAPAWNHVAGDRLESGDINALLSFRQQLRRRTAWTPGRVPGSLRSWIEQRSSSVPWFRKVLPVACDIESGWTEIPAMSRETIAVSAAELVSDDADLDRMVCYRTSGTTGHPLLVPHHPAAAAMYLVLIEEALERYCVRIHFNPEMAGCILLGAQKHTVTYATTLSFWNGCGFAKINLCSDEWPRAGSPRRYLEAMNPAILTGDPVSFGELLSLRARVHPRVMISTAVAMSPVLKRTLEAHFNCPVIEWYSLTETGPIAYSCPCREGYHVLPHDIYLEVLDAEGNVLPPGEIGEITISGGRNPYVPLLRYRTGDWGAISFHRCICGDRMPKILELEGRKPIVFRTSSGKIVNPVDISRVLREFPLLQHNFVQKADHSCELTVRLIPGYEPESIRGLRAQLLLLFGAAQELVIRLEDWARVPESGRKIPAYRSEVLVEE